MAVAAREKKETIEIDLNQPREIKVTLQGRRGAPSVSFMPIQKGISHATKFNRNKISQDPKDLFNSRIEKTRSVLQELTGKLYSLDDIYNKKIVIVGPPDFKDDKGRDIQTLQNELRESVFIPVKEGFESSVKQAAIPYAEAISSGHYPEYSPQAANEIFEGITKISTDSSIKQKALSNLARNFQEDKGVPENITPEEAQKIGNFYQERARALQDPSKVSGRGQYGKTDLSVLNDYSLPEIASKLRDEKPQEPPRTAKPTFSDDEVRKMQAATSQRVPSKVQITPPSTNPSNANLPIDNLSIKEKAIKALEELQSRKVQFAEQPTAASATATLPQKMQNWVDSTVLPKRGSTASEASSDVGNAYDFASGFNPEVAPIRSSMAPKVELPETSSKLHKEYEQHGGEAYDNYFKRLAHRAILESMENPIEPYSEPRVAPFSPEENIAFDRLKERLANRPEIEGEHKLNTFFKRNLRKSHGMDAADRDYNLASVHSLDPGVLDAYKEPYTENIINNQRKKFQDRLDEQLKRVDSYFNQHNMANHPTHIKQRNKLLKDMEEQWLEHEQKLLKDRHNDAFEKFSSDRKHFLDTARSKSSDAQRDAQIAASNAAQYGSHLNQTESAARQNIEQLRNYGESARMHHQGEINAAKQNYDEANAIKEYNLNRMVNAANQTAVPHVESYKPLPPQASPEPPQSSMWTTLGAAGGQFSKIMQDQQAADLQRRKTEAEIASLNRQNRATGGVVESYMDKYKRNLLEDANTQRDLHSQEVNNFSPSKSFISGFSKSLLTRKPDQRGFESLGPAIAAGSESYDLERQQLEEKGEKSRAFQRAIQNTLYKMEKDKEEMAFKKQKVDQDEAYKRDLLELKKAQISMASGQRMSPEEKAALEIDKRKSFNVYKNGQLAQNSLENVREAINAISQGETPWFGADYTKGVKSLISKLPQQYRFNLSGNKEKDIQAAHEAYKRAARDAETGEIASQWTPEYGSFNNFLKSSLNKEGDISEDTNDLEKKNIKTESESPSNFVSQSETQKVSPEISEDKIEKKEFIKSLPKMSKDSQDKVFAIFEKAQQLGKSAEDAYNDVKKIIKAIPKGAASGIGEKEGYLSSIEKAGMALIGSKAINKAAKDYAPLLLDKLPAGKAVNALKKGAKFISKATDIPFNFKDIGKFGTSFVLGDRIAEGIKKESGVSDSLFADFVGMAMGSGITSATQAVGKYGAQGILKSFEKFGWFDPKKYDQYIKDGIDPTLAMVAKTDEAKNKIQKFMKGLSSFSPPVLFKKFGKSAIKESEKNIEGALTGDIKTLNTEGTKALQEGTQEYLKESYKKASEWQDIINSELKRAAKEKMAKSSIKDKLKYEIPGYKSENPGIENLTTVIEKLPSTDPSRSYVETFLDSLNKKGAEIDFNALRKAEEGIGKIIVSGATPLEKDNAKKVAKELNESVKKILRNTSDKAIDAYEKRQAFYKDMFEKTPKKPTGKSRDAFDLESKYESKAFQDQIMDEFKNDHKMFDFRIEKASPDQVKKFGQSFINELGWNEEKSAFDLTKLVKGYNNSSNEQKKLLENMYSKANPKSEKSFRQIMDTVNDYKLALEAANTPLNKTALGQLPVGGGLALASQVLPARLKMLFPSLLVKLGAEAIMYNPSNLVKLSKAKTKYEFSKVFSQTLMENQNKLSKDELEKVKEIQSILEEVNKK